MSITKRDANSTQCFEGLTHTIGFAGIFAILQQAEDQAHGLSALGGGL